MKAGTAQKISNAVLSCAAGLASFIFSLTALLYLKEFDQKILAALAAGVFCLMISYIASERPNSESARSLAALSDRLMAVEDGDLISPAPPVVRRTMPKLAAAVDTLFAEVRASIENAHALGMYDPVTSLPNRLHFRSEVDKLLGSVPADSLSGMLFVDLDRFKNVNKSFGLVIGDSMLLTLGRRLARHLNPQDTLARLGGDQFAILLITGSDPHQVATLAERVRLARSSSRSPASRAASTSSARSTGATRVSRGPDLMAGAPGHAARPARTNATSPNPPSASRHCALVALAPLLTPLSSRHHRGLRTGGCDRPWRRRGHGA